MCKFTYCAHGKLMPTHPVTPIWGPGLRGSGPRHEHRHIRQGFSACTEACQGRGYQYMSGRPGLPGAWQSMG